MMSDKIPHCCGYLKINTNIIPFNFCHVFQTLNCPVHSRFDYHTSLFQLDLTSYQKLQRTLVLLII